MLLLPLLAGSASLQALDNETATVLATRMQRVLDNTSYVNFYLTARFIEGFEEQERETLELLYDKRSGNNDFMAGYNLQFDRNGQPGQEHRTWQQLRHQFVLNASTIESSVRLEERYFTSSDKAGGRLRVLNRWNKLLPGSNQLRLGYEMVYNLNDISQSTQGGTRQGRMIGILQHNHAMQNGSRLELQYQMSYLNLPAQNDRLQHQLQLLYFYSI